MKKSGFGETKRMIDSLVPKAQQHFERANRENAEMVVDLAKVLIPVASGVSRGAIQNVATGDGGQVIDFGRKAKVIEGDRGPRPFVNPALAGTRSKRQARGRKAIRDAIKDAKNG